VSLQNKFFTLRRGGSKHKGPLHFPRVPNGKTWLCEATALATNTFQLFENVF